jgi:hypothetical protein
LPCSPPGPSKPPFAAEKSSSLNSYDTDSMAGKFTFPTKDQIFIVADQVNVTWTVNAPRISLYETCGNIDYPLEGEKAMILFGFFTWPWLITSFRSNIQ